MNVNMADRRRRIQCTGENSDEGSEDSGDEQIKRNPSELGSEGEGGNSEYESIEEEELLGDGEETELVAIKDDENVENDKDKPLDDDEDRKNPQYIPKRGTFYEHDDRIGAEVEVEGGRQSADRNSAADISERKDLKKKMWKEDDSWTHDKFDLYDQSPKSRDELVASYGYDIRNEEGPPRARRRRRYGRGPNKYTRNWEDLDAYSKMTGRGGRGATTPVRGGRRKVHNINSEEDFPALVPNAGPKYSRGDREGETHINTGAISPVNDNVRHVNTINSSLNTDNEHDSRHPVSKQSTLTEESPRDGYNSYRGRGSNKFAGRGSGGKRQPRYNDPSPPTQRTRAPVRGRGENRPGRGSFRGSYSSPQAASSYQEKIQELTEDLKSVSISNHKEEQFKPKRIDNKRPSIPPRLQDQMRTQSSESSLPKPKRYSSQRQRSVQDQPSSYQQPQQFFNQEHPKPGFQNQRYEGEIGVTAVRPPQVSADQHSITGKVRPAFVPPVFTSAPTFAGEQFMPRVPAPRMLPAVTQSHLISGPRLPAHVSGPPPMAGPVGGPPPMAGPVGGPAPIVVPVPGPVPVIGANPVVAGGQPVTCPQFLPPENMINYVPPPGLVGPPQPFPVAPFQTFTPVSQEPPAEIYSNGVTYYNTHSQQHPRVTVPLQKRPKAAIPIVPPPERGSAAHYKLTEMSEQMVEYDDSNELVGMEDHDLECEDRSESSNDIFEETEEKIRMLDECEFSQESFEESEPVINHLETPMTNDESNDSNVSYVSGDSNQVQNVSTDDNLQSTPVKELTMDVTEQSTLAESQSTPSTDISNKSCVQTTPNTQLDDSLKYEPAENLVTDSNQCTPEDVVVQTKPIADLDINEAPIPVPISGSFTQSSPTEGLITGSSLQSIGTECEATDNKPPSTDDPSKGTLNTPDNQPSTDDQEAAPQSNTTEQSDVSKKYSESPTDSSPQSPNCDCNEIPPKNISTSDSVLNT